MSQQPEPPASIAKALSDCELVEINGGELESITEIYTPEACDLIRAQAVWDALLAEGELTNRCLQSLWAAPNGQRRDLWLPVLVIPLPVAEPRDTEERDMTTQPRPVRFVWLTEKHMDNPDWLLAAQVRERFNAAPADAAEAVAIAIYESEVGVDVTWENARAKTHDECMDMARSVLAALGCQT